MEPHGGGGVSELCRAIETLKYSLDPGNKTLVAQALRHVHQKEAEAVSDFIHLLEKTLQVVYIDDIIVFSGTWKDHLQHQRLLMSQLEEVGLKLKPSKCHFAKKEVEYLGFKETP